MKEALHQWMTNEEITKQPLSAQLMDDLDRVGDQVGICLEVAIALALVQMIEGAEENVLVDCSDVRPLLHDLGHQSFGLAAVPVVSSVALPDLEGCLCFQHYGVLLTTIHQDHHVLPVQNLRIRLRHPSKVKRCIYPSILGKSRSQLFTHCLKHAHLLEIGAPKLHPAFLGHA